MPSRGPRYHELDNSDSPPSRDSFEDVNRRSEDLESLEFEEFDPLEPSEGRYSDKASHTPYDTRSSRLFGGRSTSWLGSKWRGAAVLRRWMVGGICGAFVLAIFGVMLLGSGRGPLGSKKPTSGQEDYPASEPWYPTPRGGTDGAWEEAYRKAADLVGQMTLVEKVNVTTGIGWSMGMCVGNTGPVDRLGFPSLCLQDGPLGLRFINDSSVFPAGVTVGATWNKRLMYLHGQAHGFEARMKGIHVLLGPCMGPLGRLPAGGRNWEGFGADPVLQGIAAAETIKGIQSMGVIATAKHYVANEQEHFRQANEWNTSDAISSNIDDRTLHEIYAWPFADSVRAGVGSVMCSYNQVNNSYACQNSKLLNGVLKDELGFQGFVQSDWLAQRSGVAAALAGLDMTMPGDGLIWTDGSSLWGQELTKAVLNASIPMERFNDMALRVVAAWYQMQQDNQTVWPRPADGGGPNFSSWTDDEVGLLHQGSPDSDEEGIVNKYVPVRNTKEDGDHDQLARRIAAEGIVLVKNEDGILPLSRNGSGLRSSSTGKTKIGIFGEDAFLNPAGSNSCPDRACNIGTLAEGWGSGSAEFPYLSEPASALRSAFDGSAIEWTEVETNDQPDVDKVAAEQDLCLVFITSDAGEGFHSWHGIFGDRNDLYPQKGGDDLVQIVAASCGDSVSKGTIGNTVVILHTVGPTILEDWIDIPGVKAVLIAHLPGQESGNSLADVILGFINPSGRLPYTIARKEDDYGASSHILTSPNHVVPQQNFSEGLYVDYRHFDKRNITPRYEFGYGLSYTTFELSAVAVESMGLNGTLPNRRAYYGIKPPTLGHDIPEPESALFPEGFRKLAKYIYPYLESVKDVVHGQYEWPAGYGSWRAPSPAGGGQGGNPDLFSTAVKIQVNVTNTGAVPGDSVVQLYISYPKDVLDADGQSVDMPVRVLRGFDKASLGVASGDKSQQLQFEVTRRDLSYWDVKAQNWIMPLGEFTLCLGFSSSDLPECHAWENVLTFEEEVDEDVDEEVDGASVNGTEQGRVEGEVVESSI